MTKQLRHCDLLLLLLLPLVACSQPSVLVPAQSVHGTWKSEPYETQLGRSIREWCFRQNGTVITNATTQAGRLSSEGQYTMSGNNLALTWKSTGATDEMTIRWLDRNRIVLVGSGGESLVYHRIAEGC